LDYSRSISSHKSKLSNILLNNYSNILRNVYEQSWIDDLRRNWLPCRTEHCNRWWDHFHTLYIRIWHLKCQWKFTEFHWISETFTDSNLECSSHPAASYLILTRVHLHLELTREIIIWTCSLVGASYIFKIIHTGENYSNKINPAVPGRHCWVLLLLQQVRFQEITNNWIPARHFYFHKRMDLLECHRYFEVNFLVFLTILLPFITTYFPLRVACLNNVSNRETHIWIYLGLNFPCARPFDDKLIVSGAKNDRGTTNLSITKRGRQGLCHVRLSPSNWGWEVRSDLGFRLG